jgi:exopolysaccharide biosynthesis polyprenyl glycosylphosphotransferase
METSTASQVPICEVVVGQDVRAGGMLRRTNLAHSYYLRRSLSVAFLVGLDVFSVVAAVILSPPLWGLIDQSVESPTWMETLWAVGIVLAVHTVMKMYSLRPERSSLSAAVKADLGVLLVLGLVMLLTHNTITAQSAVHIWLIFVVFSFLLRASYNTALKRFFGRTRPLRPVLVVGGRDRAEQLAQAFAANPFSHELRIAEPLDELAAGSATGEIHTSTLGTLAELESIVERVKPMEIVIGDIDLVRQDMTRIIDICRRHRLALRMAEPELSFDGTAVSFVPGFGMPIFVVRTSVGRPGEYAAKRVFDFVLAAAALLVLAPLFLAFALAIRIDSPGPVLYRSRRVGLGQRPFTCFKFRTMHVDAEQRQAELEHRNEAQGAIFKIRDDPRVTRVGRVLRKTSLDELPQLINVVGGRMSLVGPRPLPMRDNELLEDWHKRRHVVLPGLTGLWQVSGRSDADFDQMIQLDFRYIENWSLLSDMSILARTVSTVLFGRGAY